jgi:predicted alpha/beta hydrolase family esterase
MPVRPLRPTLIVPGLGDSGPGHWQTWIEGRLPCTSRVNQPDWGLPDLDAWAQRIREAVDGCALPPVIIAHSFGVLASVQASRQTTRRIGAALLVAPADPEVFGYAGLLPKHPLPFPTILVGSRSDPWMAFDQARLWASRWGSRFVDAGYVAHINTDSGHGRWPLGLSLLNELEQSLRLSLVPASA